LHTLADPAPNHASLRIHCLDDDAARRCHTTIATITTTITTTTTIAVTTTNHIHDRAMTEVDRTSVGVYSSSAAKICLVPLKHSLLKLQLLWPCCLGAELAVSISNGTTANTCGRSAVRMFCAVHAVATEAPSADEQLVDIYGMHRTCSFEAPVACEDIAVGAPAVILYGRKIGVRAEKHHTAGTVLTDCRGPRRLQCCALCDDIAGTAQ
jgi:hypothetical protein